MTRYFDHEKTGSDIEIRPAPLSHVSLKSDAALLLIPSTFELF